MWTHKQIEAARKSLKALVDSMEHGPGRVKTLIASLSKIGAKLDLENALESYVLCMSILVNHEKYGGLKLNEVERVQTLAFQILKLVKIDITLPRYSFLASDVYTALSQIYRKSGNHWRAAWNGELSLRYVGINPSEGEALPYLVSANRALRLGEAHLALECIEEAFNRSPDNTQVGRLYVAKLNALRLSGQTSKAKDLLIELKPRLSGFSEQLTREILWEKICIEMTDNPKQSLDVMLKEIKTGKTFHDYGYSLDASLWCFAVKDPHFPKLAPRTKNLYRRFKTTHTRYDALFDAVQALQQAYDQNISAETALSAIENVLSHAWKSLSLEREILIYVSGYRWLERNNYPRLAKLALSQYQAKCLQLSAGSDADVLKLLDI